jgi:hypothetical protein
MAAAVFHILVTLTVSIIGKANVFPRTFNTDGIGISFAIDSVNYREHALHMANLLQQGKLREWANFGPPSLSPFQLKLYSICLALLGPVLSYGILAVEPLNLTYYLLMLVLTYRIGHETFSDSVGYLAAFAVALWPSLLMHTTQIMRDQLFICSFLLLIFCLLIAMRQHLSTGHALRSAVGTLVALCLILLSKGNVWEIVLFALALWALMCILIQSRLKRWSWPRLIVLMTVVVGALALPGVIPHFRLPDNVRPAATARRSPTVGNKPATAQGMWSRVVTRVGAMRHRFIYRYSQSGSSVDTHVELNGIGDVVRYLPSAATIGFLAPFPRMWITPGAYVGLTGRLVAGVEMLGVYFALILVALTVFYERRLAVWFQFVISALGCIALGYVVVNVAALYRMRYPYFNLLAILAARGFQIARDSRTDGWHYFRKPFARRTSTIRRAFSSAELVDVFNVSSGFKGGS